jgi:hypothetical protein
MALTRYFNNLSDIDLAKDAVAKRPDLQIQRYEVISSGVITTETGGESQLAPATSPTWNVNDYASTIANNLLIVDDNQKVAIGKVIANTADELTFDETAMTLEEDGSTAPTFTSGSTYDFYVLTPSSVTGQTYGPFFGYVEGAEFSITDTFMKFKYGQPKAMKFQDLDEREATISGGHVSWTNTDVIEAIFNADTYGSQTSQFSYGVGHDPDTDKFYRLTFTNKDRNNRDITIVCRKCQFELTGNIFTDAESGHKMAGFTATLIADNFYPEDADLVQIIRAD